MATFDITLSNSINESLSVGDTVYTVAVQNVLDGDNVDSTIDSNSGNPTKVGTVSAINKSTNVITITTDLTVEEDQFNNQMALFSKSGIVNTSGISGYYAKVKMKNNGTSEAKLFSISSEVV